MSLFKVKRTEEYKGKIIDAFLTSDGDYGTAKEATFFKTVRAAKKAIENEHWDHTGDYSYDIEKD